MPLYAKNIHFQVQPIWIETLKVNHFNNVHKYILNQQTSAKKKKKVNFALLLSIYLEMCLTYQTYLFYFPPPPPI